MKRKTTILWITLVSLIFLLFQGKAIYAASASVAFSTTRSDFVVEDEFIVTLTAESSAGISGFQTYVAYDTTMLELTDTGRHVSGGDGLIFISDLESAPSLTIYMPTEEQTSSVYKAKISQLRSGAPMTFCLE